MWPVTDRKSSSSSFDQFKKRASDMGSLTRRGSLERRTNSEKRRSWSPEDLGSSLDTFRPVTLTVSSFFKQVWIHLIQPFRQFPVSSGLLAYLLTPWSRVLLEKLTSKLCS